MMEPIMEDPIQEDIEGREMENGYDTDEEEDVEMHNGVHNGHHHMEANGHDEVLNLKQGLVITNSNSVNSGLSDEQLTEHGTAPQEASLIDLSPSADATLLDLTVSNEANLLDLSSEEPLVNLTGSSAVVQKKSTTTHKTSTTTHKESSSTHKESTITHSESSSVHSESTSAHCESNVRSSSTDTSSSNSSNSTSNAAYENSLIDLTSDPVTSPSTHSARSDPIKESKQRVQINGDVEKVR